MRGFEYTRTEQSKLIYPMLREMADRIGQMVYDAPDQFSFFEPDYSPGKLSQSALVSPEAELLTMSFTLGQQNGYYSLVNYGLVSQEDGFGPKVWDERSTVGSYDLSVGYLGYSSSSTPRPWSMSYQLFSRAAD